EVLQVYFNELTGIVAFALIKQGKRIWGVDYDQGRGWHLHPVDHPEAHENINPPTIKEIVTFLSKAWGFLD
ncbi:MAG: hypothetical protein PWP57_84, partial [Candidatus Atribacteria bacterium]|nr:hypothetical protein [Candidatus Atribacteria bacterium]